MLDEPPDDELEPAALDELEALLEPAVLELDELEAPLELDDGPFELLAVGLGSSSLAHA